MDDLTEGPSVTAEYNIVLAGRVGVGKSALFRRLRKNDFEETCASETLTRYEGGSERWVYRTEVGGEPVKITLWDTGGLERYTAMTSNYFRYCHALLLVYDLEQEESLYCLKEWVAEAHQHSYCKRLLLALWGNKSESLQAMDQQAATKAFAAEYNIPPTLQARVSARSGEGVKESFETLVGMVHEQLNGEKLHRGQILDPLYDSGTRRGGCGCVGGQK